MVGIITLTGMFPDHNFGCLLQQYALKTYLNQNMLPSEAICCPSFSALGACRRWVFNHLNLEYHQTEKKFGIVPTLERRKNACGSAFLKRIIQPRYYTYYSQSVNRDMADRYESIIVGSDQVWNPNWAVNEKTASAFFLSFLPPEKRFSYAASFGVESIPEEKKELYAKALREFQMISVREDTGKRIVEELTGRRDVQVLVDPTLLLTREQWDGAAEAPKRKIPEKYLLTYFLGNVSAERRQAVERKAAEMGCETIWLMDKDGPFYAIGPQHFLYLIRNAQMVCTDSFHGSVFSFLYGRPMAIFDREGSAEDMSSRIRTLADKFSLEDCLAKGNEFPAVQRTDYSAGYAALEAEREKSKAFLDMVFQEAERAEVCK